MAAQMTDRHPVAIAPLPPPPQAVSKHLRSAMEPSLEQQHPQEHERAYEKAITHGLDVSTITPRSSIDAMFDSLYQASVAQDHAAMGAVSQAYLQSPHGEDFLQQGREYNQQLERQQAMEQQMIRKGPTMSR